MDKALIKILQSLDNVKLRNMYNKWDSFKMTIDLMEMVLAKSELSIAAHYDQMLVEDSKSQELGQEVHALYKVTEEGKNNRN